MTRPTALPVNVAGIPEALKAERRWVCWRYEWQQHDGKKGRWTKILCTPVGRYAKSNDASTWTTFEDALVASTRFDGVGFCLGNGWAGRVTGELDWVDTRQGTGESNERYVLRLVTTIRNNLFHGGKYPKAPVSEVARNKKLLDAGIVVMNHCLELSDPVRAIFNEH